MLNSNFSTKMYVSLSNPDNVSSKTITCFSCNIALINANLCFCPPDKFDFLLSYIVFIKSEASLILSSNLVSFIKVIILSASMFL